MDLGAGWVDLGAGWVDLGAGWVDLGWILELGGWILGGSWLGVFVALVSVVGLEWIKGGGCVELGWMLQDIGCSGGVVGSSVCPVATSSHGDTYELQETCSPQIGRTWRLSCSAWPS